MAVFHWPENWLKNVSLFSGRGRTIADMELRILWSLLWRSVLMVPAGVLLLLTMLAGPLLLLGLPVSAGVFFCQGMWVCGVVCLAAVLPAYVFRRWVCREIIGDGEHWRHMSL